MSQPARSIHVVSQDEVLVSSVRAAASALEGWALLPPRTVEEILAEPPQPGDVILLDGGRGARSGSHSHNVYESCRRLAGNTRCRTWVVVDEESSSIAEPIALFCGATGALARPLSAEALRGAIDPETPAPTLDKDARQEAPEEPQSGERPLPERLLSELGGPPSQSLVSALIDPDTSLFNFEFLNFKLDEEFKRAARFRYPLSCVMLGFEGPATPDVLRELAGIFLTASRDTDVLGRFDESSFLFLLPNTGPDGARIMARRIQELALERGLADLVGDPLQIAVGIACYPHPEIKEREDLFARTREAFFSARDEGAVVNAV